MLTNEKPTSTGLAQEEVLRIDNLYVEYRSGGGVAKAVNGVNLTIHKGEAVGLVGESGAGKTTTALSILNLLPEGVGYITRGDICFNNQSVLKKSEKELNEMRGGQIGMVFANPLTSLNPVFTIGHQVAMVLMKHRKMKEKEANEIVKGLLEMVGIPGSRLNDYPYQLSGGMRQRVGIIAALACDPQLLIADEPTTALDVTIQAQILELMKKLQAEYATSLLMITHNLGIISELCQSVAIMYGGEIVEYGSARAIFDTPKHWYTHGLLHAIPKLTGPRETLEALPGLVANAQNLPSGCKFHERCSHCMDKCRSEIPPMSKVGVNHFVACWDAGGQA